MNYPFNRSFTQAESSPLSVDLMLCKWTLHIKMVWINTMTIYCICFGVATPINSSNDFYQKKQSCPVALYTFYHATPFYLIVCSFIFQYLMSTDHMTIGASNPFSSCLATPSACTIQQICFTGSKTMQKVIYLLGITKPLQSRLIVGPRTEQNISWAPP